MQISIKKPETKPSPPDPRRAGVPANASLTTDFLHGKITALADVVELVDSVDLGAVTSVKFPRFHPS